MFTHDKIDRLANLENATAYAATDDKFVFCIDLLGLTAGEVDGSAMLTRLVSRLEDRFDDLDATKAFTPAVHILYRSDFQDSDFFDGMLISHGIERPCEVDTLTIRATVETAESD